MNQPSYFGEIQAKASQRWQQLEADPELAGPWHQLFRQVQSPRHVLSELLQNADDAGATEALATIENGEFIFMHNGEDFTEVNFASLCRFGFSNKRSLHTIGFRGIGFKSIFSLGDYVKLFTPTLSVAFHKSQFSNPVWIDEEQKFNGMNTIIRVMIQDEHRQQELEKNLKEWLDYPVSLLFFRSIRYLSIGEQDVRWISTEFGPIAESEQLSLSTDRAKSYLLIHSPLEPFPVDAVEEIRQERMVSSESDFELPPCRVEIVLGMDGRLFVVLPTGVKTTLSYACNAPFIQDPARVKIKDPEISPTNRWLLKRIGETAAHGMLSWLNLGELDDTQRSEAYALHPSSQTAASSLEDNCTKLAEQAFKDVIKHEPYLLSETQRLVYKNNCVIVPPLLLDIWTPKQIREFFLNSSKHILNRQIQKEYAERLLRDMAVSELQTTEIINIVKQKQPPKPRSRKQQLLLWSFLATTVRVLFNKNVNIVPVDGSNLLYSPDKLIRLGDKKLLTSDDDWQFLSPYLVVLDPNWPRFLNEQRRIANEQQDDKLRIESETAIGLLQSLGLDTATDVNSVISQVAKRFFSTSTLSLPDCIRFAHIAAALDATVDENFLFRTQQNKAIKPDANLVVDIDFDLETFIDETRYMENCLHDDYSTNFKSCTKEQWKRWISSGHGKASLFVTLAQTKSRKWGRDAILKFLQNRGIKGEPSYTYVTDEFVIEDWDFEEKYWQHWHLTSATDPQFWSKLFRKILEQPTSFWSKATTARVLQVATSGGKRSVTHQPLTPAWIMKFRAEACLPDTWGNIRQPAELLLRTPDTEALLGVEPFVAAELDTEANRPLLIVLGVRNTPAGPELLLERLKAIARSTNAPLSEILKWYQRLDHLYDRCTTEQVRQIKDAFAQNKLIFTHNCQWAAKDEVFLQANEDDVPDATLVHPSVQHLALWNRVGVSERPTVDLAISWLKNFDSGQTLSAEDVRRVRSLLAKYPVRIWGDCGHWLNLQGEWVAIEDLRFALTMQSLVPWKNLFPSYKQQTADLQSLSAEVNQEQPFSALVRLANCIEHRFDESRHKQVFEKTVSWTKEFGRELQRIEFEDQAKTENVRKLGLRLSDTAWFFTSTIETTPYIDGKPAGTSNQLDVLWHDTSLYVENRSAAQLANIVAKEIGRVFGRQEIIDACMICYERTAEFIQEYLAENFTLIPAIAVSPETGTVDPRIPFGRNGVIEDTVNQSAILSTDSFSGNISYEKGLSSAEVSRPLSSTPQLSKDLLGPILGEQDSQNRETQVNVNPSHASDHQFSPTKPIESLMQRFAHKLRYQPVDENRFIHSDGTQIAKTVGNRFPWEKRSVTGNPICYYWVREQCLQSQPLEIESDRWELIEKYPDIYALILLDTEGNPIEMPGTMLRSLRDDGFLTLYPASYRLVHNHD